MHAAPKLDIFKDYGYRSRPERVESASYDPGLRGWSDDSCFWLVKYGLIDKREALRDLQKLAPNWDSYGAAPPNRHALTTADEILTTLEEQLLLPTTIVPSAEGGVSIYFQCGSRTAYVECYNDGDPALVLYDDHGSVEVLEIGAEVARQDLPAKITNYLG